MAKLYTKDGHTAISWQGQQFEADANGVFEVPDDAAPELAAFGLIPGEPETVTVPVSQWKNDVLLAKAAELGLELAADIKRPDLIKAVSEALKAAE